MEEKPFQETELRRHVVEIDLNFTLSESEREKFITSLMKSPFICFTGGRSPDEVVTIGETVRSTTETSLAIIYR